MGPEPSSWGRQIPVPTMPQIRSPIKIKITSPQLENFNASGSDISLQAEVVHKNGKSISNVEFLVDGNSIDEVSEKPYSATWINATEGFHSITVRATDEDGNQIEASLENIAVGENTVKTNKKFAPVHQNSHQKGFMLDDKILIFQNSSEEAETLKIRDISGKAQTIGPTP